MIKRVVITIPAYNEEKSIGDVLKNIKTNLTGKYNYRLLVVDDGSTDRTAEIAKQNGAVVISHPNNYGLAEAFKTEIAECIKQKADIIVHTDADGQYPAELIPKLISEIENGASLVLGSRFKESKHADSFVKDITNRIFAAAISSMIKHKITDSTTGFRAFTQNVAQLGTISNHTYTQEQIIRTARNKLKIVEIPIQAKKTRRSRLMKSHPIFHPFEYAVKAWVNIFRIYRDYEPLKFFGYIGSSIISAGLILGLWLFWIYFNTAKVGHPNTAILAMLLVVTGLQILLFGFLADMKRFN